MDDGAWPDGDVAFEIDILTDNRFRVDRELVSSVMTNVSLRAARASDVFAHMGGMNKVQLHYILALPNSYSGLVHARSTPTSSPHSSNYLGGVKSMFPS